MHGGSRQTKWTIRWIAPELLLPGKKTSNDLKRADIYSLSIILAHIISRTIPFCEKSDDEIANEKRCQVLEPWIPDDTPDGYEAIMRRCWSQLSEARPQIHEVLNSLKNPNKSDSSTNEKERGQKDQKTQKLRRELEAEKKRKQAPRQQDLGQKKLKALQTQLAEERHRTASYKTLLEEKRRETVELHKERLKQKEEIAQLQLKSFTMQKEDRSLKSNSQRKFPKTIGKLCKNVGVLILRDVLR